MVKIAVLVSGGGTNLQKLLDTAEDNPHGEIVAVISSSPGAYALERAKNSGVSGYVIPKKDKSDREFCELLLECLEQIGVELVVLAGFLCVLTPEVIARYPGRIVNVHPSLIPAFCGKGYYGLEVHRAALARGVKITGATVHLVNEGVDEGKILLQKAVEVREDDTPESLQLRVMREAEQEILHRAVAELCRQIAEQE